MKGIALVLLVLGACRKPADTSRADPPPSAPLDATTPAAPIPSATSTTSASTTMSADPPSPPPLNLALPEDWAARPKKPAAGYVPDGNGPSIKVETGSVFEVARVPLASDIKRLVVPKDAVVKNDLPPNTLFVATKKSLSFQGHPPTAMPLEGLRANMGLAIKVEGDAMLIGTFGSWTSKEGGVDMEIVVRAPAGVVVTRRADLGGDESVSGRGKGPMLGYWYGRTAPTSGWERVALEIDPRHLAASTK